MTYSVARHTFQGYDGNDGGANSLSGATIAVVGGEESETTDGNGVVSNTLTSAGIKKFKAERPDSIHSNSIVIIDS
jgi:hypothetical protein